jgi:uncharacterized membrane protein YdbT with pleckstrin-like domain
MSYVQRVLQPGEVVRHTASIHWIVYVPSASFIVAALAAYGYAELAAQGNVFWQVVAGLLGIIGLFLLIPEWFTWWTTEIAVTNRRVIHKERLLSLQLKYFLRLQTNEMNMDKIESVQVEQSLLGQFLKFGDVRILGTGIGGEPIKTIADPVELRNHITAVEAPRV